MHLYKQKLQPYQGFMFSLELTDTTGGFIGKRKLSCWQTFNKSSEEVVIAFSSLGVTQKLGVEAERTIETFVCQLYNPGTSVVDFGDFMWKLFTKEQLETQKIPPTQGALHEAIARAHYQTMVWFQTDLAHPQLPSPTQHGWKEDGDRLVPISKGEPPGPFSVLHLIKC
jgi:hypothetical protein